jgi:hypothetical protein
VFRGQYLPLSLSKRGVPYIKKKKKASAKQKKSRTKKEKNQKCGCPILPSLRT